MLRIMITNMAALIITVSIGAATAQPQKDKKPQLPERRSRGESEARTVAYLVREVRRELVMLPYYGVFDWLEGEVKADGTVILRGEVVRPTTKSDAGNRVKKIEGVEQVVNEIEVLPLSTSDDQLRLAVYRAIFDWNSPLFRYATQAIPPIHLIVKNGRVILKGIVATKADSDLARIRANGVSGVFEVRNELRIEDQK